MDVVGRLMKGDVWIIARLVEVVSILSKPPAPPSKV